MTKKQRLLNLIKARKKWKSMPSYKRKRDILSSINFTDRGRMYKYTKEFHLPIETAIYVPSTNKNQQQISKKAFSNRIDGVRKYLSGKYGGYTSIEGLGGYKLGKKIIKEPVVKVTAFSTSMDYKKNKGKIIKKIGEWRKKWGQDSIGYEYEGDLYYFK